MHCWSVTIAKVKNDVPYGCLGIIHTWIQIHCTKGAVATEVSSQAHQLHVQSVIECFFPVRTHVSAKIDE